MRKTKTVLFYGISFATNAVILIFEITGGRLLAPYLGTSVEVWAGIIGIVLGGMALGYWIGGKIGDKNASHAKISGFLFGAGASALLAWGLRDVTPTMFIASHLPITLSALLSGTILFMPTVILLAAVSPLLAKNLIQNLNNSARVVGMLNAVGTLGSILGAVLTGLFLIPHFGVSGIMLGLAGVIFILAFTAGGLNIMRSGLLLIFAAGLSFSLNLLPTRAGIAFADVSTSYNRIWVDEYAVNGMHVRTLSMDPYGTQCAIAMRPDGTADETLLVFSYIQAFDAVARTMLSGNTAPSALFLGGCNYSYPRAFLNLFPPASVDVVEIDPGMTEVAKKYFGFEPERYPGLTIFHEDARMFLNAEPMEAYDIVFMDTFGSQSGIPQHLTTAENFKRIRTHMKDDGVLVINVIGAVEGPLSAFTASLAATVKSVFPETELYSLQATPAAIQNLLIIASPSREFPKEMRHPLYPETVLIREPARTQAADALILTDDYAPVEALTKAYRH